MSWEAPANREARDVEQDIDARAAGSLLHTLAD
jgi:hypothetical protein